MPPLFPVKDMPSPNGVLPHVTPAPLWRRWWTTWTQLLVPPSPHDMSVPVRPRTPAMRFKKAILENDLGAIGRSLSQGMNPARRSPLVYQYIFFRTFSWTQFCAGTGRHAAALLCHAHEMALIPDPETRAWLARSIGQCLYMRMQPGQPRERGEPEAFHNLVLAVWPYVDDRARAEMYASAVKDKTDAGVALLGGLLALSGTPTAAAGPLGTPYPMGELFESRNERALRILLPHLTTEELEKDWGLGVSGLLLAAAKNRMPALIPDMLKLPRRDVLLNIQDHMGNGETVLMACVCFNDLDVALQLLDAGESAHHVDFPGENALHHLAWRLSPAQQAAALPLWRRLLVAGASPEAVNHKGMTPNDVLARNGLPPMEAVAAGLLGASLDSQVPSPPASGRRPRL